MAKKGAPLPAWLVTANTERRLAAEEAMRQRRPPGNPFVWVVGSEADYPGIVIDRRRVGAGWQIYVAYTSPRQELMQQWLDAEQLLPYESPRAAARALAHPGPPGSRNLKDPAMRARRLTDRTVLAAV